MFGQFGQALRAAVAALLMAVLPGSGTAADELTARARLAAEGSALRAAGAGVGLSLQLTQAVPWRVFTLDAPRRLVVDLRQTRLDGLTPDALGAAPGISALRMGAFRAGWSRLVLDLDAPLGVAAAGMTTDPAAGSARIDIRLAPVPAEDFAAAAGAPPGALWPEGPAPAPPPKRRQTGDRPLIVVLDPGHGGIDPGAQYGGHDEADLMLTFARELQEKLVLSGRYEVILTRTEDVFVPLQARVSRARAAGADVFLSLHADALPEGHARGATIYTLSETASNAAAAELAERHDRDDLLAGVDLGDQGDMVAGVLMDLARTETVPRSERLAQRLVEGLGAATAELHKRPWLKAGFSVLKGPEIPSALIEVGFMSSPRDLANLTDPAWRARAAAGILAGLDAWAIEDAAEAELLRR